MSISNFTILPSLTILGTVTPIFGSIYANSPGQICSVRYRLVGAHVVADDAHPFLAVYLMSAYAPKRAIRAPGTQSCRHRPNWKSSANGDFAEHNCREDLITAENLGTHLEVRLIPSPVRHEDLRTIVHAEIVPPVAATAMAQA